MTNLAIIALAVAALTAKPALPAAAPASSGLRQSAFHCAARTPGGDLLLLEIDAIRVGDQELPLLFVSPLTGSPWPSGTFMALPKRRAGNEMEFELGPRFIRLGTNQGPKNLTILSGRGGRPAQAIAFGYCDSAPIEAPPAVAAAAADDTVLRERWQDSCYFVAPGRTPRTGRFQMNHRADGGRFEVTFSPVEGDLWSEPVSSWRELLSPPPRSEARGISLGVGRFAPDGAQRGPRGMDMIFIDERARRASIVVRFEDFGGASQPAFAICGVNSFEDRTE